MIEGSCPNFLSELLPQAVAVVRPNSRNASNLKPFKCRTETFKSSFFPACTAEWNKLPSESRNVSYFSQEMRKSCNPLFYEGTRHNNIKHSQLRMKCSKLNAHLFSLHVVDTMHCSCGHEVEDTSHFMLHCPLFAVERIKLFDSLRALSLNIYGESLISTLLYGDESFSYEINKKIFDAVHLFITDTDRL